MVLSLQILDKTIVLGSLGSLVAHIYRSHSTLPIILVFKVHWLQLHDWWPLLFFTLSFNGPENLSSAWWLDVFDSDWWAIFSPRRQGLLDQLQGTNPALLDLAPVLLIAVNVKKTFLIAPASIFSYLIDATQCRVVIIVILHILRLFFTRLNGKSARHSW